MGGTSARAGGAERRDGALRLAAGALEPRGGVPGGAPSGTGATGYGDPGVIGEIGGEQGAVPSMPYRDLPERGAYRSPLPARLGEWKCFAVLAAGLCVGAASNDSGWAPAAKLPEPIQEMQAAVLKGRIYVVGGINAKNEATQLVYRYDPGLNRWERLADLPDYRHHMPVVVLNDSLYAIGGYAPPGFSPVGS